MPPQKYSEIGKEKSLKHHYAEIIVTNVLKFAFTIFVSMHI